tara:strand:+ start:475 stop:708 length:234 start_codon:yes stop_codon:yes gene_type:complete
MENTRKRKGRVPFGYEKDPEDPKYLKAIPEQLEVLEEISGLISSRVLSLREGSAWIYEKTGRTLSYQGLKNIVDQNA